MVVAILAVLTAGSAYVPRDPRYPAERLEYIARQTRAVAIIARAAGRTEGALAAETFVDPESPAISGCSDRPLSRRLSPMNAAYVIYTSGSTGAPKGVVIQHSSAMA